MYINTNVAALFAQNSLNNTQNSLNNLQQEMSTGYQINSPANNPSGLAISNLMQGEIGASNAAISNATEASNLLNVANGGMQTDVQIVQEIQQLAVQASNSTNNASDTQDIQNQIQSLMQTLDNVSQTLNYNNQFVLNQGAQVGTPSSTDVNVITLATTGGQFISAAPSSPTLALGSYSLAESYTSTVLASLVTTGSFVSSASIVGAAPSAGSYQIEANAVTGASTTYNTVTVGLYDGTSLVGTLQTFTVATASTSGTYTVALGGVSVAFNDASFSVATSGTVSATLAVNTQYNFTASLYSSGVAGSTATFTVTANATTALAGSTVVNLDNQAFTLNLASISSTGQFENFSVANNSPLANLYVGADSGGVAAGTYSVSMSYSVPSGSSTGVDYITITNASTGSVVASGSVGNMSSTGGVMSLQLVTGNNSTGSNSFVLDVNQASLASVLGSVTQTVQITGATQYEFQTGPNQGNGNATQIEFGTFNSTALGLNSMNVTNQAGASYAITQAQMALSMLTNAQGKVGAQVDQMNYTLSNLQTETTNLQSSQATIMDANMATVTSQFAQQQILMQTGIQALSTSQQLPSLVLKLLG